MHVELVMKYVSKCLHEDGKGHDCAYVDAINKYIPEAEKIATKKSHNDDEWNKLFHSEMHKLTTHFRHIVGHIT